MTKGQRTIASLLAVVAVLLAVNIIIQTSRPAEAGGVARGGTCPTDITQDGFTNVNDLVELLLAFGDVCQ